MTGSALMDFFIGLLIIAAEVWLFFLALPRISPDETFTQIGKVVVGVVALIIVLIAVKNVLFGGGGGVALSGGGLIRFGIGLIVVLIVVFLLYMAVDYFIPQFAVPVKYVIGGVALIALLYLMGSVLAGGSFQLGRLKLGRLEKGVITITYLR